MNLMKNSTIITSILLIGYLVLIGCTPDVVDPEFYGTINGTVVNSANDERINGASIETSPPTEVLLTDENGTFELLEVPTGSYQIKVSKSGFKSNSVSLKVNEDRTTSATVLLEPTAEESISNDNLHAQVTSWDQRGIQDSSFVDVEFRVRNTSSSSSVAEFEIYFDIHTNGETFYYETRYQQLAPGEQNFGAFEKYVRDRSVDSVVISDIWLTDADIND